jgi:hypothetical protein
MSVITVSIVTVALRNFAWSEDVIQEALVHTMVTEFHEIGPLLPVGESGADDEQSSTRLLLMQVNTFLVERRWAPDVVRVQAVVTPLPGAEQALFQLIVTHPAAPRPNRAD